MPRFAILIKAQGDFKHSGKYYLLNGRWHKLHADKTAPKGAPVAAHPSAAGIHMPKQHLTDDEWKQLELPPENVNASTFNKQLATIKQHAENGDVTAILGSGYGTNTYGKKLSMIANHVLGLYGSEHKVAPGQKAGEHAAVATPKDADHHEQVNQAAQQAADKAAVARAPKIEPAAPSAPEPAPNTGLAMPAFQEGKTTTGVVSYYEKQAQKVMDLAAAGDAAGLAKMKADGLVPNSKGKVSNTWAGKTANSKLLMALHSAAVDQVGDAPAKPAIDTLTDHIKIIIDEAVDDKDGASLEHFAAKYPEGSEVHTYAKEGLARLAKKEAKPAAEPVPAPAPAPEPVVAPAPAPTTSKVAQIPWDSQMLPEGNSNAKSHNGKVAQIKAMAEAGDLAGLEAFKAGTNTYGKKQMKLAALAIAALKDAPAAAAEPVAAPVQSAPAVGSNIPAPPEFKDFNYGLVAKQWHQMAENGEWSKLVESTEKLAESAASKPAIANDPETPALVKYATTLLKHGNAQKPAAPEPSPENSKSALPEPPTLSAGWTITANKLHGLAKKRKWDELTDAVEELQEEHDHAELWDGDLLKLIKYGKELQQHEPTGPKEGDTKPGADGMLVLKNGHWVKVEPDAPAEQQHPVDALDMPNLEGLKYPGLVAGGLHKLKQAIKEQGASALKGATKKMSKSGALITSLPHPTVPGKTIKIKGYEGAGASPHNAIYHYVESLKEAAGKPAKAAPKPKPKPKPTPAPTPAAAPYQPGVESMDGWQQTGPQGGSNPGGKFKDADGVEWYCKFPGNEDVAKSEVLAAKLYAAAGIAGQDAKLVTKDGKLGIASKWQTVSKASPAALAKTEGVAAGFAVDAWLGNWDVVGLGYDNLQVGPDGKAMRVDAGGSLEYRAQGGKKAFGNHVVELDSLRDAKINPQAAAVFGKMSQADITASVSKVLGVSDSKIHALVHAYGPGDAAAKQKMIDTLIARKADLAAKYPKAKKEKKVKPFKPEKISAPPSFMNWGGSGKSGPSSKEFLNAANEAAVQAIYAAAQTGNLDAVKGLSAAIYNKESGEVSGNAPVLEHPSQHVKGYAQQAVNEINYQLNPPKRFRFEGGHPLHSLNSAYPSHKGAHADIAKVGKYILLGEPGTVSLESLALPKHTYQSGAITQATFSPAAKKAIASMPETQKQAIKSYTGSSYHSMNQSLWAGNPSGAAKSAGEALHALGHDITPGTVLSRKITLNGGDLDQILGSTGKILQEPAIMSTSIRPSSWSGNVQLKMHVGPGVKGLWVGKGSVGSNGAMSNFPGEDELILPPNTRLLILSVKKSSGPDADGFGAGVGHVIEAVILPTQASA